MTNQPTPLTELQLDEIEGRAAALYEYATVTDYEGQAELEQLTDKDVAALVAEVRRQRAELADLHAENAKLIRWHGEDDKALDKMRNTIVGPRVELAEAGAAASAVETGEEQQAAACAKCKTPFDPDDARHDGHAREGITSFCRRCVDRCHESTDAFHVCAVCREGGE